MYMYNKKYIFLGKYLRFFNFQIPGKLPISRLSNQHTLTNSCIVNVFERNCKKIKINKKKRFNENSGHGGTVFHVKKKEREREANGFCLDNINMRTSD